MHWKGGVLCYDSPEERIRSCSLCSTSIVYMKTHRYKTVPVDYTEDIGYAKIYDPEIHTIHWNTCGKK